MSRAEELAKWCDENSSGIYRPSAEAAAELRRLDAENAQLRAELEAIYSAVPVAEITSWTNGSYWRNYKVNWIGLPEKGTKLIPLPERKS